MLKVIKHFQEIIYPSLCSFTLETPHQGIINLKSNFKLEGDVASTLSRRRQLPELPLEIWLEIFHFATYVHRNSTIVPLDPFTPRRISRNVLNVNTPLAALKTKLSLVLVSKEWRYMSVQILYQHIVIRSPSRALAILKVLEDSQLPTGTPLQPHKHGQWTRHIEFFSFPRGCKDVSYLQTAFKIINCCPNLQTLSGNWTYRLPIEFYNAISGRLGSSLTNLYWNEQVSGLYNKSRTGATPQFLGSFRSLCVLDLRHFVGSDSPTWKDSTRPTLAKLRHLIISTHADSLEAATFLHLPSLQNLTLETPIWAATNQNLLKSFLQTHGSKLMFVDMKAPTTKSSLDSESESTPVSTSSLCHVPPDLFLEGHCPNLERFIFPVTSPAISVDHHNSLRQLGLRYADVDGMYPGKVSATRNHLMSINADKFPKLEDIQMINFVVEAHTDSLIKDVFIWWVEWFEEMGINFFDGEGVLWMYSDSEEKPIASLKIIKKSKKNSEGKTQ